MKILLTLFILLFLSSVFAEDISDFEIEGISIGDSLLDYFSEKEIKKAKKDYGYNNDDFTTVEFYQHPSLNMYKNLSVSFKSNDTQYLIYELSGFDFIDNDNNECFDKVDIVSNEISKIINQIEKISTTKNHTADPTGKSKVKKSNWWFESKDLIKVECWDWSKEITENNSWFDNFAVTFVTDEYLTWLDSAY